MNKAGYDDNRPCRILMFAILLFMFVSCKGQESPKYIGAKYGVFDLDKITFSEQLDTLFSGTEKYYMLPKGNERFDGKLGKYMMQDTMYYIYRIPPKNVVEGTFRFRSLEIKPKEVVDFYADHSHHFRKVEVSVYMNDAQFAELRAACKEFRDVTPENVRKVNNGNYSILQCKDVEKQTQTTLYCLDNSGDNSNDSQQNFFVRISKTSLSIQNDKFYEQFKDDIK